MEKSTSESTETRPLTKSEQRIMDRALRASTTLVGVTVTAEMVIAGMAAARIAGWPPCDSADEGDKLRDSLSAIYRAMEAVRAGR